MKNIRKIKRQQVTEKLAEISPWDLTGSAEKIYKELKDTENFYLEKYDPSNTISYGWDWEEDENDKYFTLTITRLENDKEYNTRVKKLMKIKDDEKVAKEQENKNDYEQYLRLKKKFETNPYRTNDRSAS